MRLSFESLPCESFWRTLIGGHAVVLKTDICEMSMVWNRTAKGGVRDGLGFLQLLDFKIVNSRCLAFIGFNLSRALQPNDFWTFLSLPKKLMANSMRRA